MRWVLDPGLLSSFVVVSALLYAAGLRRRLATGRRRPELVALTTVVPPLVVLGAPWLTIWRAVPLEARRSLAHGVLGLPAVVRRGLRGLVSPVPACLAINVDLAIWHVPWLYDLTL